MPYFISDEQDDCAGWATIKIDDDGAIETIGCHETMNDAVAQMLAVSLDEGIEPGGEYDRGAADEDVEERAAVTVEVSQGAKRGQLHNVREVRQYGMSNLEVREDTASDSLMFAGYASVFNHDYEVHDAFGSFTERLAPGAFSRTLAESPDVVLLINHEGLPLARTKSGTLRLSEDTVGLRVEAELDPYDPDVRALLPKMRRGDLDEMSFAFRVNGQSWSEDYSERTITEVNLARGDVSIVSFGANPATIAALRAALSDEMVRQALFASDDAAKALVPAPAEEVAADEPEVVEEPVKVAKPRKKVSKATADDAPTDVEDETGERISTLDYLTRLVDARRLD
jgi:HK97 family phage prohead protease